MKKNSRTNAEMFPIVAGFSSSGKTVKEYAKFHGIKYYTYKYWLRKYRAAQKQEQKKSTPLDFIPLNITAVKLEEHSLDIVFPNGVQIRLSTVLDIEAIVMLKKLVSCLD